MLTVNKKFTIVRLLCAFAIAIALSVAVIFAVSEEPVTAIYNLFLGPLQSKRHFFEVFASSVPLIFTGLALGLVFKSGNFSMIADACLYTGAVVTAALAIKTSLPFAVHPIVIMIAAAAVGGLIGSIPALLKVYFHTNELVTSLMFNYVFFYLGIYNVTKFLADREAGTFASKKYQATASLGKLISGTNFHVGYLIAIAAVILLYILVYKTKFGYEVRISGSNPEFAKYSGIRTSRVIIMTQVIAGAVAGLGGAVEQMGMYQRFNWQDSPSYAWDGVIIAILSGNNPDWPQKEPGAGRSNSGCNVYIPLEKSGLFTTVSIENKAYSRVGRKENKTAENQEMNDFIRRLPPGTTISIDNRVDEFSGRRLPKDNQGIIHGHTCVINNRHNPACDYEQRNGVNFNRYGPKVNISLSKDMEASQKFAELCIEAKLTREQKEKKALRSAQHLEKAGKAGR